MIPHRWIRNSACFLFAAIFLIVSIPLIGQNKSSCSESKDSLTVSRKVLDYQIQSSKFYEKYLIGPGDFSTIYLDSALHFANKAIEQDSNYCQAYLIKYRILGSKGQDEKVVQTLRRVSELTNAPYYVLLMATWIEKTTNNKNEAQEAYKDAAKGFKHLLETNEEFPDSSAIFLNKYYYGISYYLAGEKEKAIDWMENLKEEYPENPILDENLNSIRLDNREDLLNNIKFLPTDF